MTCTEIHAYFESDPRVAINLSDDSAEFSEHFGKCPECHRFIQEQKELAKRLHLLRNCVPAIPGSLDAAVLAGYRTYLSDRSPSAAPLLIARRISLRGAFSGAAVVALLAVVGYGTIFLFTSGQRGGVHQTLAERRPVVAPPPTTSADRLKAPAQGPIRKKPKAVALSVKRTRPLISVAQGDNSFPTRFQSLMYCDQLSCPGAMDVIRVRLPSPILGNGSVSSKGGAFVSADVLVGPDGIARGIRLVE